LKLEEASQLRQRWRKEDLEDLESERDGLPLLKKTGPHLTWLAWQVPGEIVDSDGIKERFRACLRML